MSWILFFCILKSNLISEQLIFQFIWKHDMWNDNTKKWRMCFLVYYLQTYYRNDIYFFYESIFVCVDHCCLSYFIVEICRAISVTMFFLTAIKTFILCETSFSFIWFDRNVLCASSIDIYEIMYKNKQIQKCENNRLKISLNV